MIIAYLLHTFAICEDQSSAASLAALFLLAGRSIFGSIFAIVGDAIEICLLSELKSVDYLGGGFRIV